MGLGHRPIAVFDRNSPRQSAQHLMGSLQSLKTLWGEEGQRNG